MKLLLDTHTLLWVIGETSKLSKKAVHEIKNPDNDVLVSAVSLWEIALKHAIGKLSVDFDINNIPDYCKTMGFEMVPLKPEEALNSLQLPSKINHKDPFDRMLIYQCIKNEYTLVSGDAKAFSYRENGLKILW